MTSNVPIRTYGRAKKIESNYTPKPVSPFRITEASTAIDALLSKNIEKRKTSFNNKDEVKKRTRRRSKKNKNTEHLHTSCGMFDSDSLDIKVNSTFDNLLQGPVYNQVNICNNSSLFVNSNTDTSNSRNLSLNVQSNCYIRSKRIENYKRIHSIDKYNHLKNSKKNVLPKGKIKKRKNSPRKYKRVIKNVINISDDTRNNHDISKKMHSYLDKSVNYSLIIDRQSKHKIINEKSVSCARKFTPIAASKLSVSKNYKPKEECSIFHHGFRHLMRAENTPRIIHSSTPIVTRNIKVDDKLNVSPITASVRGRLNFTVNSNSSKSLFESKKLNDISSIQNTANNTSNKNNLSNVILINTTNLIDSQNVQNVSGVIINDTIEDHSLLPNFEDKVQPIVTDKNKTISKYIKKTINNTVLVNDVKLNGKAIVLLENHFDVFGIKNDTSVIYTLTNSKINIKKELIPVVRLEKMSLSKYIDKRENEVTQFRNLSRNSQISNLSRSLFDEHSVIEISNVKSSKQILNCQKDVKERDKSRITTSSLDKNEYCNLNSIKASNDLRSNIKRENFRVDINSKCSKRLRSSVNLKRNSQDINKLVCPKKKTRQSNSNGIQESKNIIQLHAPVDEKIIGNVMLHRNKLFDNNEINISVPKNFITTRKKRVKINIEPITNYESKCNTKPLNMSSKTWATFSQCTVRLQRIEQFGGDNKIIEQTHANIGDDNTNRKSIFLKPGKQWFRSLSLLRRTQLHELEENVYNEGRKWKNSICEVHQIQDNNDGAFNKIDKESPVNDMKNKISSSRRGNLGIRKSLKIINISINNSSVLAEEAIFENKSGYVSTLAHVSILESFDKLSLSTNVNDREETARQIILKRCGQTDPIPFDDCYSSRALKKCRKIGEGVYGEVFMYKSLNSECRVMKVIPIEGNLVVNGERQKKFEEIISEIIIASELSNLRINNEFSTNGFGELLQVYCVQGKYPQHLLDLWDLYDEERGSENDSPVIFTEDQLYIVLELANGGQDLESYRFNNAEQSYSLFVQIVCSLAVAESALQFEHRDMHWGNILISPIDEATINFRLKGREFEVASKGVKVSIIDFTLSRLTYDNYCIYNDLGSDPDLFVATGDYQFDIYRLMKQRNENEWQAFEPYTNILWLDYTLEKMIGHVRYLRDSTKVHKTYIRKLSHLRKKILNFNSASELLNSDVFSHMFL